MSNFGLACSNFMEDNQESKNKVAIAGGVMLGLSGLCTGVAVSYYAAVVVQDFYMAGGMSANGLNAQGGINDSALGNRYIYGTALFIGWFSLVMGLIGMLLQIVGTTSNNEDMDDDYRPYGGNPGYNQPIGANRNNRPGTEFI